MKRACMRRPWTITRMREFLPPVNSVSWLQAAFEWDNVYCSCRIFIVRKVSDLRARGKNWHTWRVRSRREPREPLEFGFSPKHSESSAMNVLEHCRDGGANCLLTTTPVSWAAQHHRRRRISLWYSLVIFWPCGAYSWCRSTIKIRREH